MISMQDRAALSVAVRRSEALAGEPRGIVGGKENGNARAVPSKVTCDALAPGRGDFWILKIAHAPSPKNPSKNGFLKKIFRCGKGFRCRR